MTEHEARPRVPSDDVPLSVRITRAVDRRVVPVRRAGKRHALRAGRTVLRREEPAHMLHIGKTGGTALKAALGPLRTAGRYEIRLHKHATTLRHLPRGEKVFFVLRDPVERYVSAFNSRLRQGMPRYYTPWTPEEEVAFGEFHSADELGCSLSGEDAAKRARALAAMSSIQHVRDTYWRWLINGAVLQRRHHDLLLAMWLPDIDAGFARLSIALELPGSPALPDDEFVAHRSPNGVDKFMSECAIENVRRWYARDYACIEICSQLDCFVGPSWTSVAAPRPLAERP